VTFQPAKEEEYQFMLNDLFALLSLP